MKLSSFLRQFIMNPIIRQTTSRPDIYTLQGFSMTSQRHPYRNRTNMMNFITSTIRLPRGHFRILFVSRVTRSRSCNRARIMFNLHIGVKLCRLPRQLPLNNTRPPTRTITSNPIISLKCGTNRIYRLFNKFTPNVTSRRPLRRPLFRVRVLNFNRVYTPIPNNSLLNSTTRCKRTCTRRIFSTQRRHQNRFRMFELNRFRRLFARHRHLPGLKIVPVGGRALDHNVKHRDASSCSSLDEL